MHTRTLSSITLSLFLVAGCGGDSGIPKVTLPDTADGTAKTVVEQLLAGNPRVLYDAMPASYQKDVGELVHTFGAKMDAELLRKGFGILDKIVILLEAKKDWILEGTLANFGSDGSAKLANHWDSVVGITKALANSDLRSTAKLQSLDVGTFLGTTGCEILTRVKAMAPMIPDDPFAQLARMSFRVAETKDGIAAVQMLKNGEESGRPEKFQQVEGRWIMVDMAKDWPAMMVDAKKQLGAMDLSKQKGSALEALAEFEKLLDGMIASKDKDEFKKQLLGAFSGLEELSRKTGIGR